MDAIQTLKSRDSNKLIERAFIKNILQEEVESLMKAQDRVFADAVDNRKIELARNNRSFNITDNTIVHKHNIQQRFIDMQRTQYGKQKALPVHNKILFGHFNEIIYRVSTNLTQAVRAQIANDLNLEMYG